MMDGAFLLNTRFMYALSREYSGSILPLAAKDKVINPIEKWIEALDENKKRYERLLQTEREKVALLEKMLDKK